jgi:hypothetical protein
VEIFFQDPFHTFELVLFKDVIGAGEALQDLIVVRLFGGVLPFNEVDQLIVIFSWVQIWLTDNELNELQMILDGISPHPFPILLNHLFAKLLILENLKVIPI